MQPVDGSRMLQGWAVSTVSKGQLDSAVFCGHHSPPTRLQVKNKRVVFNLSCLYLKWKTHTTCHVTCRLGEASEKNTGLFGDYSQVENPPPPLLGTPRPKKKYGLFCILGPKKHFWFSQKCSLFVSILTYTFGNRGPPPLQGKNSQIIPFLPIFFQN